MEEGFTKEVGIRVSRLLRASWLAREFQDAPWWGGGLALFKRINP